MEVGQGREDQGGEEITEEEYEGKHEEKEVVWTGLSVGKRQ